MQDFKSILNAKTKEDFIITWQSDRSFFTAKHLKIIAIITMLLSHLGQSGLLYDLGSQYYELADIFVFIGRIAMPIFCFFTIQAVLLTKSFKNYILRMFVFAFISEIPFDLALFARPSLAYQNVIFTLIFGALTIYGIQYIGRSKYNSLIKIFLMIICIFIGLFLAELLNTDYGMHGVLAILLLYIGRDSKILTAISLFLAFLFEFEVWGMVIPQTYGFVYLSIPLIMLYNGKRGNQNKWAFYIFYPAHLLVIYLLKILLI